jgi:hypothetical protein
MNRQEVFAALAALMFCWIIDFASFSRGAGHVFWRVRRLKSFYGRRSLGQSGQELGHQAERECNHQEHAEPGEDLQRRRRIELIRIVSRKTMHSRMVLSLHAHSIP